MAVENKDFPRPAVIVYVTDEKVIKDLGGVAALAKYVDKRLVTLFVEEQKVISVKEETRLEPKKIE